MFSIAPASGSPPPRVLRVGTWRDIDGQFATIQAAVDAARAGDWVLVAPGDWRGAPSGHAGVAISTPDIHLRGMDRNAVIVDGTKGGVACNADPAEQTIVPKGLNGIEITRASGVSVENLTVCNFLAPNVPTFLGGPGASGGDEIYFDGGSGTAKTGLGAYTGRYLTATSTFYKDLNSPMAANGLRTTNASGPGLWQHVYASNMAGAGIYLAACPDCNAVFDDAHAAHAPAGFLGVNAGSRLTVQNSEFNDNRMGVVLTSQNNGDAPPPQDGACPHNTVNLATGNGLCTVISHNHVHDNNDANVPSGPNQPNPPGMGIVNIGGRNDLIAANTIDNNGGWGVVTLDWPDFLDSSTGQCAGAIGLPPAGTTAYPGGNGLCYFQTEGNQVRDNQLRDNGFFGNPSNSDLAIGSTSVIPGNCFVGNVDPDGVTSDPPDVQTLDGSCGGPALAPSDLLTSAEAVCGSQLLSPLSCDVALPLTGAPRVTDYPVPTRVTMPAVAPQPSMPDPCVGVPANPWCAGASVRVAPAMVSGTTAASEPSPTTSPKTELAVTGIDETDFVALGALFIGAALIARRKLV